MKKILIPLLPVLISLSLVYFPSFWWNTALLLDFYTPFVIFESPMMIAYHKFLTDRLPDRDEEPLFEIDASEATPENIRKYSKGYSFPLIIRGMLSNDSDAIKLWNDPRFWLDNYSDEEVLCIIKSERVPGDMIENCTVGSFFRELAKGDEGKPYYITASSNIFDRNPQLHAMANNDQITAIEPGLYTATQVFMGPPGMGSDIHCALGINIFRQIAGQKKWWFIPTDQTSYLRPSISLTSFAAYTKTFIGKDGDKPSPHLKKVRRYTSIVNPGDVVINPPWYWHGILNLGNTSSHDDLVIGVPSRYAGIASLEAGMKTNFVFTINGVFNLLRKYGRQSLSPGFKLNVQTGIQTNVQTRKRTETREEMHPMDVDE